MDEMWRWDARRKVLTISVEPVNFDDRSGRGTAVFGINGYYKALDELLRLSAMPVNQSATGENGSFRSDLVSRVRSEDDRSSNVGLPMSLIPAHVDQDGNEKESDSDEECLELLCQLDMDQLRSILMETTKLKTHGIPGNGTTSSKSGFHIQKKALAQRCLHEGKEKLLKNALLLLSKCKCGNSKQRQQFSDVFHGDCLTVQRATEMERNLKEMKQKQDLFWQTTQAEVEKHVDEQTHTAQAEVKKHVDEQMHEVKKHVDEQMHKVKKHVDEQMHEVKKHVDEQMHEVKKHVQMQMHSAQAEVKKHVQDQMYTANAELKEYVQEQTDAMFQTHMEDGLETQKEMYVEMASSLEAKIESMKNRKRPAAWMESKESRPQWSGAVLKKPTLSVYNASDSGSTSSAVSVCSDTSNSD